MLPPLFWTLIDLFFHYTNITFLFYLHLLHRDHVFQISHRVIKVFVLSTYQQWCCPFHPEKLPRWFLLASKSSSWLLSSLTLETHEVPLVCNMTTENGFRKIVCQEGTLKFILLLSHLHVNWHQEPSKKVKCNFCHLLVSMLKVVTSLNQSLCI